MKILVVSTVPLAYTGITNVILNYLRFIDRSDMDITVLSTCRTMNWCLDELKELNVKHVELKRNNNPLKYLVKLVAFLKNRKFDIFHVHGNSSTLGVDLFAAKKAKIKVRIAHGHSVSCTHKLLHFLLKPLFWYSYTHGFACSEKAGKWMFGSKEYYIIKNAFDIDKYKFDIRLRQQLREKMFLKNSTVIGDRKSVV